MTYSKRALFLLACLALRASSTALAADCSDLGARRVARFTRGATRAIAQCLRRTADCPDVRLTTALDRRQDRIARSMPRRCAAIDLATQLAAVRADLECTELARCGGADTMTLTVVGAAPATSAGARASAEGRRLRANAGWTGLAHRLQILEGAAYTAELSNCDGDADTTCDFSGPTAGTAFGAPSPLSVGGIAVCVTVDFVSDITGTVDLASGALSESAEVEIGVFLGPSSDSPCPACVPNVGAPTLGDAGICHGGVHDGSACVIQGLGDPSLGANRGTSADCGAGTRITTFRSPASATTGSVSFGPRPDGPRCTAVTGKTCPCGVCNDGLHACRSSADCPEKDGMPGVCGSGNQPTRLNSCLDDSATTTDGSVCVAEGDGAGRCQEGPVDDHCSVSIYRWCGTDFDCPAGEQCVGEHRSCHPDTIELAGDDDAPSAGVAHPTLVGAFCMASSASPAVNTATGLPGPVSYVWPTEVRFGQ